MSYIADATESINVELKKLSIHNKSQNITFNSSTSNIESFISEVSLASKYKDKSLLIGGDGRLNQIYLSLWAAKNEVSEDNIQEVSLICIEEPEAHLHPHQQRKLAEYLNSAINGQVILTSHSPQIASEFSPNSIIRITDKGDGAFAASKGCSKIIDDAFNDFGYRMSIVPAEAFYADCVLLVEGQSEMLFYKTLAKQVEIDLDRLNISILSVEGVGFKDFITILDALEIEWVIRTDNDIFKIPQKEAYRFAGVQRLVGFLQQSFDIEEDMINLLAINEPLLKGFPSRTPAKENIKAATIIIKALEKYGLLIAKEDLENDLYNSSLQNKIIDFYADLGVEEDEILDKMQARKASSMYEYLRAKKEDLKSLKSDDIAKPLLFCVKKINNLQNDETH